MISLISSTDVAILADKILEQILVSHLESENNIFWGKFFEVFNTITYL